MFIATNSIKSSYAIEKALLKALPRLRVKVINSDNSHSDDNANFVKSINEKVAAYDVLIVSPSLTSGVSIHDSGCHFDETLGFFYSNDKTSGALDAMQQLNRVRYAKRVHVWYENKSFNKPTNKAQILNQLETLNQYLHLETNESGQLYIAQTHPYANLLADVQGLENSFLNDGLNSFKWLAMRDGWEIVEGTGNHETGKQIKQVARDDFKNEESTGILNAEVITAKQAYDLEQSDSKTRAERHQLERFKIEQFHCEQISEELLKADADGTTRKQVRLREIISASDDDLLTIVAHDYSKAAEKWATPHLKPLTLVKLYHNAVLSAYDDPQGVCADSESVQRAVCWITENARLLNAIGIDTDIKPRSVMSYLGYAVAKLGYKAIGKRATVNGKRTRFYALDTLSHVESCLLKRAEKGVNFVNELINKIKPISDSKLAGHTLLIDINKNKATMSRKLAADDSAESMPVDTWLDDFEACFPSW